MGNLGPSTTSPHNGLSPFWPPQINATSTSVAIRQRRNKMGSSRQHLGALQIPAEPGISQWSWLFLAYPVHLGPGLLTGVCLQGQSSAEMETGSQVIHYPPRQVGGPFLGAPPAHIAPTGATDLAPTTLHHAQAQAHPWLHTCWVASDQEAGHTPL